MGRAELDLLDLPDLDQLPAVQGDSEEPARRSRLVRVLFIVVGCCLAVVLGAAGIFFWSYHPQDGKQLPGEANISSPYLQFDRFMINLKDESGKNMIVLCDLILEAVDPGRLSADQKMDLRRTVYRKFKQRRAEQVRYPKFKQEFAGELKTELNGLYGDNFITNVYFTRFYII
jgi:flagellar basal body-associated protein FliL